jgi:hypothetical protein
MTDMPQVSSVHIPPGDGPTVTIHATSGPLVPVSDSATVPARVEATIDHSGLPYLVTLVVESGRVPTRGLRRTGRPPRWTGRVIALRLEARAPGCEIRTADYRKLCLRDAANWALERAEVPIEEKPAAEGATLPNAAFHVAGDRPHEWRVPAQPSLEAQRRPPGYGRPTPWIFHQRILALHRGFVASGVRGPMSAVGRAIVGPTFSRTTARRWVQDAYRAEAERARRPLESEHPRPLVTRLVFDPLLPELKEMGWGSAPPDPGEHGL